MGTYLPFDLSRYVISPSHQVCKVSSVPLLTLPAPYLSHHTPTLSSSFTVCYKRPSSPGRKGSVFQFLGFLLIALSCIHHCNSCHSCAGAVGQHIRVALLAWLVWCAEAQPALPGTNLHNQSIHQPRGVEYTCGPVSLSAGLPELQGGSQQLPLSGLWHRARQSTLGSREFWLAAG